MTKLLDADHVTRSNATKLIHKDAIADAAALAAYVSIVEADILEAHEAHRSLRESVMQMFIGVLEALAFLTPVVVNAHFAGPSWIHWTLAIAALALTVYVGTLLARFS